MIKKLILSAALIAFITGCSDKESNEQKEAVTENKPQEALKIEVIENKNKNEIKVAQKAKANKENESYYYDYNSNVKSEYDPNSKPANEDAGVRVKPRTNIDANMHVRSPYEKVKISMMVKRLSKEFIVKCSACHNDYANGIIGPSLLDKDSDFIFNSINKFKNDKNANVLMTGLVNQMSKEEIRALADEIYEFNKQIKELK